MIRTKKCRRSWTDRGTQTLAISQRKIERANTEVPSNEWKVANEGHVSQYRQALEQKPAIHDAEDPHQRRIRLGFVKRGRLERTGG